MHILIANQIGRIHHAAQHPALTKTRPTYAFVPEQFFGEDGLNRSRYLTSRWPSINCNANPLGIGSHVIPDAQKPVNIRSRCPVLREFMQRLEHIAAVKSIAAA